MKSTRSKLLFLLGVIAIALMAGIYVALHYHEESTDDAFIDGSIVISEQDAIAAAFESAAFHHLPAAIRRWPRHLPRTEDDKVGLAELN